MKKVTTEEIVERIKGVHGDYYDLSKVKYTKATEKIELVCKKHGSFWARSQDVVRGTGCPVCGNERKNAAITKPFEYFLKTAREQHGERYDYEQDSYTKLNAKVNIVCKIHGKFAQAANHHISGAGCPRCQINGFNPARIGTLYLLSSGEGVIKVGITNRQVTPRLKEINKTSGMDFRVVNTFTADGQFVFDCETYLLNEFAEYKYDGKQFSGSTECFDGSCFSLLSSAFVSLKTLCPAKGTVQVKKKVKTTLTPEQIKEKKRADTLAKTGTPVGVVVNQGSWVFQETIRENGIKKKFIRGRFKDKTDAVEFAHYFYKTGQEMFTRKNLLYFNEYGYIHGVLPKDGKWQASRNIRNASKKDHTFYIGFSDNPLLLEDEVITLLNKIKAGVIKIE